MENDTFNLKLLLKNNPANLSVVHSLETQQLCQKFAEDNTNNYSSKRNVGQATAIRNIFMGKLAEIHAKSFMENLGFPTSVNADFLQYDANKKSFDSDLSYNIKDENFPNVHVKSCKKLDDSVPWKDSWTFQLKNNKGSGGTDNLFNNPESKDLVCFVVVKYDVVCENNASKIYALLPWRNIINSNILKDPCVSSLIGLKKCVFYADMKEVVGAF